MASEQVALSQLTPFEMRIACDVAHCFTNREIAQRVAISESAVLSHNVRIKRKLGVSTRVQIALLLWRAGVVSVHSAWTSVCERQGLS